MAAKKSSEKRPAKKAPKKKPAKKTAAPKRVTGKPAKGENARTAGSGRKKGTPNRTTAAVKRILLETVEDEPEVTKKRLLELRDSSDAAAQAIYWRLVGKMIPNEVAAKVELERPLVRRLNRRTGRQETVGS